MCILVQSAAADGDGRWGNLGESAAEANTVEESEAEAEGLQRWQPWPNEWPQLGRTCS